jgi:exopolysaccharide production protein ExoZ
MPQNTDRLDAVQILRAVAALAVTFAHTVVPVADLAASQQMPNPLPGAAMANGAIGVDLFFVISGFMMVYTTWDDFGEPRASGRFFLRRLLRIAPLYWLATCALMLYWIPLGTSMKQEGVDVTSLITSFLFIFHQRPNGVWTPVLGQGWTLNFEMFFYASFAIALLFPRRAAVGLLLGMMILSGGIGRFLPTGVPFALRFMSNSLLLWEFAFGVAIAFVYSRGLRMPRSIAALLIAVGIAFFVPTAMAVADPSLGVLSHLAVVPQSLQWGMPCAMILAGAVFMPQLGRNNIFWRTATFIGDTSYSLYLFHGFVMLVFVNQMRWVSVTILALVGPWGCVAFLVVGALLAGAAIYVLVERPMTRTLRRLLERQDGARSTLRMPLRLTPRTVVSPLLPLHSASADTGSSEESFAPNLTVAVPGSRLA